MFIPFDVLCASVYCSYTGIITLESVISPMRFCVYMRGLGRARPTTRRSKAVLWSVQEVSL